MNKKLLVFFLLIVGALALVGCSQQSTRQKSDNNTIPNANSSDSRDLASQSEVPADKIEVVHFHATRQCWSCLTVGEYALKTIKEKFPEEYTSGKIIFKDINGELKENQEIVTKYQARGSSLFINAIRGKEDNIAEDTTVWRLVTNETQFTKYFEDKLKALLGK